MSKKNVSSKWKGLEFRKEVKSVTPPPHYGEHGGAYSGGYRVTLKEGYVFEEPLGGTPTLFFNDVEEALKAVKCCGKISWYTDK